MAANRMLAYLMDEDERKMGFAILSGIALVISFMGWGAPGWPFDPAWIAIVLCGYPIIKGAIIGLVTRFDIKADVLVAIALLAALVIHEIFAAGEVAFIMALGAMLEERTVRKAREGIEKLVNLTPRTARVLRNGEEVVLSAQQVQVGDVLRVLPGETVAVDGVITFGQTAIDQSLMTGESLPVDKAMNDAVFSGTVNQLGTFDMRATKVGEDSALQRMIRLVESADADKAPIVRIMDRWATWIVVAALTTALGTWAVTGEVIRAVTILVVFCPCALVLATPTAIMAGIGNATKFGVLMASGDALERLAKVQRVAFDKTGTLTHGKPEVIAIESFDGAFDEGELLALAAVAEQRSEHPLGRAIVRHAKRHGMVIVDPLQFGMVPGRGVKVRVADRDVVAGNAQLMDESGISVPECAAKAVSKHRDSGCTVIYLAVNGTLVGIVALADTLRPDAQAVIQRLHALGTKTILLTGDHVEAAQTIAAKVGIDEVRAALLPEDKVRIIDYELQQQRQEKVCMVGDGINDAPALKKAYVSLAMGGVGSDIAVDAADGVFVRDDIKRLPYLLKLARKTAQTIVVNITLSMALNFVTVVLAALGFIGPVLGALAHNVGAFIIVLNSARLLRFKDREVGSGGVEILSPTVQQVQET